MRTYKTEAIILKRSNFGEAEKLLTIFTKHYGKIRVRAPGIRRITSRKAPHLELFNLSSLFLAQGKNIDIVTEAVTINNFSDIKKDLKKVSLAYYFCELVDLLCAEKQENREIFQLLSQKLACLETEDENSGDDFANRILWGLGFLPRGKTLNGTSLDNFMENILERKVKSQSFLNRLKTS